RPLRGRSGEVVSSGCSSDHLTPPSQNLHVRNLSVAELGHRKGRICFKRARASYLASAKIDIGCGSGSPPGGVAWPCLLLRGVLQQILIREKQPTEIFHDASRILAFRD